MANLLFLFLGFFFFFFLFFVSYFRDSVPKSDYVKTRVQLEVFCKFMFKDMLEW